MVAMDVAFYDLSYEQRALNLVNANACDAAQVYATLAIAQELARIRMNMPYNG